MIHPVKMICDHSGDNGVITLELCDMGVSMVKYLYRVITE